MTEETTNTKVWPKIAMVVGAVVLICSLLLIVKWQHDQIQKQTEIEKSIVEMKQLAHDIVRAQAQYASKEDIERLAKQAGIDLSTIRDDLEKLNAQVRGISTVTVASSGFSGSNLPSTGTTKRPDGQAPTSLDCPNCDPFGYQVNVQLLAINEPFADGRNVPFGEVQFRAWEERPWSLKVHPRKYSVTTVLGEDEDGRHYTYNRFSVSANGETYPVKIEDAKYAEEKPDAKFRFSPRLYLGVDIGTYVHPLPKAEVTPNLQVSLFSYGKTKVNPEWTFVGVGLGFATQSERMSVVVSPVNYNIAQHLPLVENLHVGPTITADTDGGISVMGGLRVGM